MKCLKYVNCHKLINLFVFSLLLNINFARTLPQNPLSQEYFPTRTKRKQKRIRVNPFIYSYENQDNYLIDEEESDLILFSRINRNQIIHFLKWWETKYYLLDADLEAIYGGQHILDQKKPGRYWRKAGIKTKNMLRNAWFKEHNELLLPEFKLYLRHKPLGKGQFNPFASH